MADAMTALRTPISLPTHGALELPIGMLALVAPFALGFELAGTVLSLLTGVCIVGLALDAAQTPAQVSAHQAFDYGIAFAAVLVAVPLALDRRRRRSAVPGARRDAQLTLDAVPATPRAPPKTSPTDHSNTT